MIYDLDDKILHEVIPTFDFEKSEIDPLELFNNMKETMIALRGFGLSCNQVGLPYRMFVFGDYKSPESITGVFNPKIIEREGFDYLDEGCLSYPNLVIKIKRSTKILTRFQTFNSGIGNKELTGLSARIFQHETDHLNGKTFIERSNRFYLDKAKRKFKKLTGKTLITI